MHSSTFPLFRAAVHKVLMYLHGEDKLHVALCHFTAAHNTGCCCFCVLCNITQLTGIAAGDYQRQQSSARLVLHQQLSEQWPSSKALVSVSAAVLKAELCRAELAPYRPGPPSQHCCAAAQTSVGLAAGSWWALLSSMGSGSAEHCDGHPESLWQGSLQITSGRTCFSLSALCTLSVDVSHPNDEGQWWAACSPPASRQEGRGIFPHRQDSKPVGSPEGVRLWQHIPPIAFLMVTFLFIPVWQAGQEMPSRQQSDP